MLPTLGDGDLVVPAPDDGPGNWAGAPSALVHDGVIYLAYRIRRPIGQGRGGSNVVARSTDGMKFETVALVTKERFGAESLERPALVLTDDGKWRLYVSCATPGTKHWRVDVVEALSPEGLTSGSVRTTLPGDETYGVKDPVILRDNRIWHLWASCHPLDDPDATDRMTTEHASGPDGMEWTWHGTALAGRPGQWDARGVRITSVWTDGPEAVALYDGRATAEENWEERTGLARGDFNAFTAAADGPIGESPYAGHGLRYVSVIEVAGARRAYYEVTRADGAHELRTCLLPELA
jgi:hypothetical protein